MAGSKKNQSSRRCSIVVQSITVGMRVKLKDRYNQDEVIDELLVIRLGRGGSELRPEVTLRSLRMDPGAEEEFAFFGGDDGWRMLFEDPMTGGRCYSQRAPSYILELAE